MPLLKMLTDVDATETGGADDDSVVTRRYMISRRGLKAIGGVGQTGAKRAKKRWVAGRGDGLGLEA